MVRPAVSTTQTCARANRQCIESHHLFTPLEPLGANVLLLGKQKNGRQEAAVGEVAGMCASDVLPKRATRALPDCPAELSL